MLSNVEKGYHESIYSMCEGIILSVLLGLLTNLDSGLYYPFLIPLFEIGFLISNIYVIFTMEEWPIWYILGWIIGQVIAWYAGFLEDWLFSLYIAAVLVTILLKAYKR
ncbi:MAG: hypothetical protein ACTSRL_17845 [Candidatus Helarchaeota archaeon]